MPKDELDFDDDNDDDDHPKCNDERERAFASSASQLSVSHRQQQQQPRNNHHPSQRQIRQKGDKNTNTKRDGGNVGRPRECEEEDESNNKSDLEMEPQSQLDELDFPDTDEEEGNNNNNHSKHIRNEPSQSSNQEEDADCGNQKSFVGQAKCNDSNSENELDFDDILSDKDNHGSCNSQQHEDISSQDLSYMSSQRSYRRRRMRKRTKETQQEPKPQGSSQPKMVGSVNSSSKDSASATTTTTTNKKQRVEETTFGAQVDARKEPLIPRVPLRSSLKWPRIGQGSSTGSSPSQSIQSTTTPTATCGGAKDDSTSPSQSTTPNDNSSKTSSLSASNPRKETTITRKRKPVDELDFVDDANVAEAGHRGDASESEGGGGDDDEREDESQQQQQQPVMGKAKKGRTRGARLKAKRLQQQKEELERSKKSGIIATTAGGKNTLLTNQLMMSSSQGTVDSGRNNNESSPRPTVVRFQQTSCSDDDLWTADSQQERSQQQQQAPSSLSSFSASWSGGAGSRRKRSRRRFPTRRKASTKDERSDEENQELEDQEHNSQREESQGLPNIPATIGGDRGTAGPRGVGVDVYDLQDDGQLQMLTDEVAFLCEGIRQNHQTSSALELAWLVSLEKNRHTLWKSLACSVSGEGALPNLFNLLAEWPLFVDSPVGGGDKKYHSGNELDEQEGLALETERDPLATRKQFRDLMVVIWHFISSDCTWVTSPAALERARALRVGILSHPSALTGLIQLVHMEQQEEVEMLRENVTGDGGDSNDEQRKPTGAPPSPTEACASSDNDDDAMDLETPNSQDSFASIDSELSFDPTVAGRKRRRKKQPAARTAVNRPPPFLPVISEDVQRDPENSKDAKAEIATNHSSLSYESSITTKQEASKQQEVQEEQWKTILKRATSIMGNVDKDKRHPPGATFSIVLPGDREPSTGHSCESRKSKDCEQLQLPQNLALLVLQRILTGRMEGEEKSCLDDSSPQSEINAEDESKNPLIMTNQLLSRQPKTISLLARTMGQATAQSVSLASQSSPCNKCLEFLTERVNILASTIDGACLFHSGNRRTFVRSAFGKRNEETLIPILVDFMKVMWKQHRENPTLLFCGTTMSWVSGVGLEVLKTLTSLTHENLSALSAVARSGAWQLLAQLLYSHGASIDLPNRHDDLAIFSLNLMANLVESSLSSPEKSTECYDVVTRLQIDKGGDDEKILFLPWLVKHLVQLTEDFRGELLGDEGREDSQASLSNSNHDGIFVEQDRDNLLLAGNGFVLLAYLLVGNNKSNARALEDLVMEHLPGTFYTSKIGFLRKVLYAFCNFYRHTVGDLSVAITAPVQSLLQVLSDKVKRGVLGPSPTKKETAST